MTTSRRALLLAAAGVSATAPGCVGRTTPAASATGTSTDPPPDATYAYTHQQPGGNRVLAGGGDIVGATPVRGTPTWLLAFARGGETYWTVVTDEGLELRATRPGYATHTTGRETSTRRWLRTSTTTAGWNYWCRRPNESGGRPPGRRGHGGGGVPTAGGAAHHERRRCRGRRPGRGRRRNRRRGSGLGGVSRVASSGCVQVWPLRRRERFRDYVSGYRIPGRGSPVEPLVGRWTTTVSPAVPLRRYG